MACISHLSSSQTLRNSKQMASSPKQGIKHDPLKGIRKQSSLRVGTHISAAFDGILLTHSNITFISPKYKASMYTVFCLNCKDYSIRLIHLVLRTCHEHCTSL